MDEKFPLDKEHFTDVVKERIEHWLNQDFCGTYDIATNNCEHLAMHVRYGHKMSKQVCDIFNILCFYDLVHITYY